MPLPKPFEGESQNDFMGRCVVDPNIVNDFGTIDQRVAIYLIHRKRKRHKTIGRMNSKMN